MLLLCSFKLLYILLGLFVGNWCQINSQMSWNVTVTGLRLYSLNYRPWLLQGLHQSSVATDNPVSMCCLSNFIYICFHFKRHTDLTDCQSSRTHLVLPDCLFVSTLLCDYCDPVWRDAHHPTSLCSSCSDPTGHHSQKQGYQKVLGRYLRVWEGNSNRGGSVKVASAVVEVRTCRRSLLVL